jgi:hypothetical protein
MIQHFRSWGRQNILLYSTHYTCIRNVIHKAKNMFIDHVSYIHKEYMNQKYIIELDRVCNMQDLRFEEEVFLHYTNIHLYAFIPFLHMCVFVPLYS